MKLVVIIVVVGVLAYLLLSGSGKGLFGGTPQTVTRTTNGQGTQAVATAGALLGGVIAGVMNSSAQPVQQVNPSVDS
jgi:hypothetical protein